jgi:large subunit ribosomal protein L24|tara:strand:- start:26 stop:343 length:318 start_codon:yes stop_codon:yes gene_type:complete
MNIKLKIKKGDEVIVLAGKDKGKKGKIVKLLPKLNRAIVSDINKVKKHQKPGNNEPGGIVEKEMPIHISNLNYFDPKLNKGVRIGFKLNKDGKKVRVNKKTGAEI